jgi:hypothetical protein
MSVSTSTVQTGLPRAVCIAIAGFVTLGSAILVATVFAMATQEFRYATWIREGYAMPALTEWFKDWYPAGWTLPFVSFLWGGYITVQRQCSALLLSFYVGTVTLLALVYFLLALLSFYISNQNFVG